MRIIFPFLRFGVQHLLLEFSDSDYQLEAWGNVERRNTTPNYAGVEVAMESYIEDVPWSDEKQLVGRVFRNEDELEACRVVMEALNEFYREKGKGLPEEQYLQDLKWMRIISISRHALRVMLQGDT